MQRKLFGIIDVEFDVTGQKVIIYIAFVKYLRKIGIQLEGASATCRLQEDF
jgi:hypothetical protein